MLWQWMFKNTLIVLKWFGVFLFFSTELLYIPKHPGAKHLFWFGNGKVENIFAIFISLSNPNFNSGFQGTKKKTQKLKQNLLLYSLYWSSPCVSSSITLLQFFFPTCGYINIKLTSCAQVFYFPSHIFILHQFLLWDHL